jgi:hypothetical protein
MLEEKWEDKTKPFSKRQIKNQYLGLFSGLVAYQRQQQQKKGTLRLKSLFAIRMYLSWNFKWLGWAMIYYHLRIHILPTKILRFWACLGSLALLLVSSSSKRFWEEARAILMFFFLLYYTYSFHGKNHHEFMEI